jgi:hypothetical protein
VGNWQGNEGKNVKTGRHEAIMETDRMRAKM